MMKLITFVLGLALGVGGTFLFSAKHPDTAQEIAAAEQKKIDAAKSSVKAELQDKIAALEKALADAKANK